MLLAAESVGIDTADKTFVPSCRRRRCFPPPRRRGARGHPAARQDPAVRLARLPAEIALSGSAKNEFYRKAVVTIPGLFEADPPMRVEGTRVTWDITILNAAKNRANATRFSRFF